MNVMSDMRKFLHVQGASLLLLALFCYGIGLGILAPMNSVYLSDSLGLSKGQIVSIFSISLVLNMIMTIMVGLVSDRIKSKKRLAIMAAALCLVGLIVYMRATTYGTALAGMCIASAPSGLIMGQLFAMSRNHFQRIAPEIVEIGQIWLRAGLSVGFFIGLLLGANLYLLADFRGVLWGNMAGYGMLLLLLLWYKEHEAVVDAESGAGGEAFSLIMLFALLLLSCADAIRGLYLPLVVKDLFGKPELMSYIWSVQAVFELMFMTLAGYWSARYGSRNVIWLGGIGALLTYTAYAFSSSLILFFLVQPLYSFFVSVLYGVAMGYVQRMFKHRTGFGSSLYVFISQSATFIGYMCPLFIAGYSPTIFVIPLLLVTVSLGVIGGVIGREKWKGRRQALHV
ncbi:MFS transporter [Paenibacillus sp. ACRRX]|uniref:MFS transporter n=1 Tax=Paenibacillus sp. ACRRX TaxID=2918206 RepID=UPI001EF4B177|nr:MFS transporter [Paenibacillus sp. ACRRX]MCG7408659.1 MFS transporter [Paenibacillus sp. ACRRX]